MLAVGFWAATGCRAGVKSETTLALTPSAAATGQGQGLAAAELARHLKTLDPEAAAMWARTIQDPSLKERATK